MIKIVFLAKVIPQYANYAGMGTKINMENV